MVRFEQVPASSARKIGDLEARVASLENELAHERQTSAILREVGTAISSVADFGQLLELILSKVMEMLDAERATLFLVDERNKELVSRITVGEKVQIIRVMIGKGIAGTVARTGKPIRVKDAYRDRRFFRSMDDLTGFRTRAILAAPMKNHAGSIIGVVQALNKRGEGEFSSEDESLLMTLASQAAVTVDNSRLYLAAVQQNEQLNRVKEQLERKVRELRLLFDLESAMARAQSLDELVRAALREATKVLNAVAGVILLPDEFGALELGQKRRPAAGAKPQEAQGASSEPAPFFNGMAALYFYERGGTSKPAGQAERGTFRMVLMRPGDGFVGKVFTTGQAQLDDGEILTTSEARKLDESLGFETRSAVGAPLEGQDGTPLGALVLYNHDRDQAFQTEDLEILRLIAANVSTAVQLFRSRIARERDERLSSIGRLLSGVIHDLKTPLTVISGYVQMMVGADEPRLRGEYAALVLRQFDLIQQMQREVLEFARGERTLWVRRVFLHKYMSDLAQALEPEFAGSPLQLSIEADDRGIARFDEAKLTRALNNLIRNAVDAMRGKSGKIVVRVKREGGAVVFSVSDTGPGIPEEIKSRLFESFVTSGKKGGTGLGLAIVKRIVDEHGGHVDVHSTPRGTTFRLVLPQKE
jgi:signal transduction histidine kinase/putative methionine-R-sulfoxide reductase with GAF domain